MFISDLIVPNEAFATVLGSGDFMIDAAFHGAGEILTFDINRNQYYPAALKLKGLQNMSYEEFWNFFSDTASKDYLSSEKYKALKNRAEFDLKLYAFFDEVMSQCEKDRKNFMLYLKKIGLDINRLRQMSFLMNMGLEQMSDVELDKALSMIDPRYTPSVTFRTISGLQGMKVSGCYLESESSYQKAQEAIKKANLSFLKTDFLNLGANLELAGYMKNPEYNRFSSIYLSNVPEYVNGEVFVRAVEEQLMPLLQENGVIAYCCQSTSMETLGMSDSELNAIKNKAKMLPAHDFGKILYHQMINSVEGFRLLSENYALDFMETEALSRGNGFDEKDTYMYIKKR